MGSHSQQVDFLERMQQCINHYKPILEHDFAVSLGPIVAKPLLARELINSVFAKAADMMHRESIGKHKRPPTRLLRILFGVEKTLLWLPMCALMYIRFWYPRLVMKWKDDPPTIFVSFSGWSDDDYRDNTQKIDQWSVHEMAHGIWDRIANDEHQDHDRRWRLWNEGFAHFVADVHFCESYPPEVTVNDDWSDFRQQGKQLVCEVVNGQGNEILREIPTRWREFDAAPTGNPAI